MAVVGSGIASLTAANALHPTHEITVFDADHRVGGHANTVTVHEAERTLAIDTGFNDATAVFIPVCNLPQQLKPLPTVWT